MKIIILTILIFTNIIAIAQQSDTAESNTIKEKVNLFFKALETRDTVLYKSLVFPNGQIWTVRRIQDTLKNSNRTFQRDMIDLATNNRLLKEQPFLFDIKVHHDIAIAWVPYDIRINGMFSHCGMDVFTFLKSKDGWKILNLSYSIEPDGCAELKKKYSID